jgi:large subunit ribosomal protein L25
MDRIELNAQHRDVSKRSAKRLRREGEVPAMLYGYDIGNIPIRIPVLELRRTLTQAGGSQLIELRIGDGQSQPVLAREIQRNVLTGDPIHVDFLAVNMAEKITAEVAVVLVGEPAAVAEGEGMLLQGATSVEIECLPGDLVPSLELDVSGLELNESLFVSDLQAPAGIAILSDPDEMVAQVAYEERLPEEEEEEEELFETESREVEVITRTRDENKDFD